jgi:hypothetical protein
MEIFKPTINALLEETAAFPISTRVSIIPPFFLFGVSST